MLLYQYGRYLMIASSRPGGLPANLQGIWNDSMRPPWSSNYTININTEMNYWPVEVAGLPECHQPLLDFVAALAENGRRTAQVNYGARGFVAHHNSDAWAHTAPVGDFGGGDPKWANWPMGGAWLATHLWEHYAFGRDEVFLRERAWPILKAASEFGLDWLIEDGQGHLVTAPSTSPELSFQTPGGGEASVTLASTMDMSILWEVFTDTIEAARVLGVEPAFAKQVEAARARLLPMKIGARGQLQEWARDLVETDVHHRHPSHLFGVYPGRRLTPEQTALWSAARRALEIRGDDGTGWSLGWKINLWARFRDGDHAYLLVKNLLRPVFDDGRSATARAAASTRTSSTRTRRSRSTATSPSPPASRRCWCRAGSTSPGRRSRQARSSCCRRCPRPGPRAAFAACGRAAASRSSISRGRRGASTAPSSSPTAGAACACAAALTSSRSTRAPDR